jgi:hypothetical protein
MQLSGGASLATIVLASLAVLGVVGGIVGLWVDTRISQKLAPIIKSIEEIKYEYKPNGGITFRPYDGKPDGTSKDLQADTLSLVQELSKSVDTLMKRSTL